MGAGARGQYKGLSATLLQVGRREGAGGKGAV